MEKPERESKFLILGNLDTHWQFITLFANIRKDTQ